MKKFLLSLAAFSVAAFGAVAETLNFTGWEFQGASEWSSGYAQRTVEFDNATVTFASANKQSTTITDCPVTKGQDITVAAKNATLTSVKFNLKQWNTKAQTATLYVSTDGVEFTETTTSSSDFVLDATTLPDGTVAAQVRFSSKDNQVGLASIDVTFAKGAVMDTELTITPVWVNDVVNGEANPIPDADGSWGKPTADNDGGKTVCRFAVGKDGKLLVNNHKENAIMAWDGKEWSTYAKLPAVTVTDWNGNETAPDSKWNGTAITTDDAGNVIYNYCFINADKSLQYWGVVAADGTITDVELSTPLEDLGAHGRLDIIGHIVGDVNSEKGGIGYATTAGSSNGVVMFHFKGDGTKVTSLTAQSYEVEGLASNGLYVPSPKYLTIDELLANGTPEKEFYAPFGALNSAEVLGGYLATGDEILKGFGNRQYNTSAVFALHGNKYIVRSYVTANNPNSALLTGYRGVMTYGIFDLATGECVASWQDSEYSNYYGMGTITAEPVDDDTVNVYMYVITGSKDNDNPAVVPGGYGGMFTVTATDVPAKPKGTKELPYIISTPEDLVNMNSMLKANAYTYFELAEDIDMAGVAYPMPAQSAVANIHLDGKGHVIKNLTINGPFAGLFSLMNGSVKNLGFVDIDLTCANWGGAGAIAGYIANNEPTVIENCFVTGKIQGQNAQLGSFACGAKVAGATISNCYSTAVLSSTGGGMQGGFLGAVMYAADQENVLTINNSYFAGEITGANVGGFVGANQSYLHPETGTEVINLNNCAVIAATLNGTTAADAFANTTATATLNADNVMVANTTVNGAVAEGVAVYAPIMKFMAMPGFNPAEVDETTNLPILAWQTGKEYKADGSEYAPYVIASVEDLCNAYTLTKAGELVYFVQTEDIDMAGVKDYVCFVGGDNATYSSQIYYDGQNHLIKNFAPADGSALDGSHAYCTSIFGVLNGTVKNLGVINVNISTAQGCGVIAAYAGHSTGTAANVENVFVTGTVKGTGYLGGIFGTSGNAVNINSCFVNIDLEGGANSAAIVGRLRNTLSLTDVYAAGTVSETSGALVVNTDKQDIAVNAENVVAFNTGVADAVNSGIALTGEIAVADAETEAALIEAVQGWAGFSATKMVYGLPGLDAFAYEVFRLPVVKSVKETVALNAKDNVTIGYELTVGFVNYNNVYACDAAGDFIQLYGKNTLEVGDVIPAGWSATFDLYNGTPELINFGTLPEVTKGTFEAPVVAAADVTPDLVNAVVTIKDVVFEEATPAEKANFTGEADGETLSFRNNYTLASVEAGKYDVTVVVTLYQGAPSLYVINYTLSETSGIDAIEAEAVAPVYYNLQGVEVANPENGIYIVRRGNKVTKEIIR